MEAIRNMNFPTTADELCQLIHCCRWVASTIPDIHLISQTLCEIRERAYASAVKRRKKALKRIPLSKLSCGAVHEDAFLHLKERLKSAVQLAHLKDNHTILVFTDASDKFWAGIVTQVEESETGKQVQDQKHEPLAFLGDHFSGAQENWTTCEMESFAIVKEFERMDYILWGPNPVRIFTDHKNLLYVFAPLALRPNPPRYVLGKVHRWAINLSRFSFVIEHIDGTKNVFAVLLTRWSRRHRSRKAECGNITALYQSIVPSAPELNKINMDEVVAAQEM